MTARISWRKHDADHRLSSFIVIAIESPERLLQVFISLPLCVPSDWQHAFPTTPCHNTSGSLEHASPQPLRRARDQFSPARPLEPPPLYNVYHKHVRHDGTRRFTDRPGPSTRGFYYY
jgi:hypothetical protein